ncbi:MAG: hypothetical protein WCZ66_01835 [Sphingomonadaceae bacterium]
MTQSSSIFWQNFNAAFSSGAFIKTKAEINGLSICSVMLEMCFGDQILAKGTGWFWRLSDGIALVTAWHNLSGLHHTVRKPISRHGGIPDRVRFRYMTKQPQTFQVQEIPLYLDDNRTQPRWFVHPTFGSYLDMAYLGLKGAYAACVNDIVPMMKSPVRPGYDVFAVGFPQGVKMANFLPVETGNRGIGPRYPGGGSPKILC